MAFITVAPQIDIPMIRALQTLASAIISPKRDFVRTSNNQKPVRKILKLNLDIVSTLKLVHGFPFKVPSAVDFTVSRLNATWACVAGTYISKATGVLPRNCKIWWKLQFVCPTWQKQQTLWETHRPQTVNQIWERTQCDWNIFLRVYFSFDLIAFNKFWFNTHRINIGHYQFTHRLSFTKQTIR